MIHLKRFEAFQGGIFPKSRFTQEDMDELYDIFQDFSITYNIKDMTVKTSSLIPSQFDDDPDTGEINQYIIGQAKYNAFIDIRLFTNEDEVIETLRDNFIPQVKALGWYIPNDRLIGKTYGMTITKEENDIETPYTEISITFAKKD
jgi:hypothetical protein